MDISNNLVKNAIRSFVVGRKNWLFSDMLKGADSSAVIYSLVKSAKANSLEPRSYFGFLLDELRYLDMSLSASVCREVPAYECFWKKNTPDLSPRHPNGAVGFLFPVDCCALTFDDLIENILEIMFTMDKSIRIGKHTYPTAYVQSRSERSPEIISCTSLTVLTITPPLSITPRDMSSHCSLTPLVRWITII